MMEITIATYLVTTVPDGGRYTPILKQTNKQFLEDINKEIIVKKQIVINAWCLEHNQPGPVQGYGTEKGDDG